MDRSALTSAPTAATRRPPRATALAGGGTVLALALALAACGTSSTSSSAAAPTPARGVTLDQPVPARVADLPLVDADGHRFTLASLHGKTVALVDFLTLCQEVCPLTSVDVEQAARTLRADGLGGKVVFVEATVDPARDTVARLAAYRKLFPADADWLLATGSPKDLTALWTWFGVGYDKVSQKGAAKGAPRDWLTGQPLTYDVEHQDVVWVLGPDGHQRWEENGTPDAKGEAPPKVLDRFLSSEGRANLAHPGADSWSADDVVAAVRYVTARTASTP